MRHIRPYELLLPRREIIKPRALNIPGLGVSPKIRSEISPGSQNYTSAGTYYFTVPNYNTMAVDVRGPGGGGGGAYYAWLTWPGPNVSVVLNNTNGGAGTASRFVGTGCNIVSNGGGAGLAGSVTWPDNWPVDGANGANGTASGGDTNTTGGGAAGGGRGSLYIPVNRFSYGYSNGGLGGAGGRSQKTFAQGALTPGTVITVTVGTLGARGHNSTDEYMTNEVGPTLPTAGSAAAVYISWS